MNNVNTPLAAEPTSDEMQNMYLNVYIGQEVYGIEIRYVIQIVGMQEINSMPEMPLYMKGFINLRGSVIPVVSMRERFGQPDEGYTERACIVITQVGDIQVGMIVDAIKETVTIEPDKISPPPAIDAYSSNAYITGIAHLSDKNVSRLLEIKTLFHGQDFSMAQY